MAGSRQTDSHHVRVIEDLSGIDEPVTAIYVRVTQEESFTTDLSIPNQKRRALELCGERGWPIAKLYAEPKHVFGDLGPEHRPALKGLLEDIGNGQVKRVLVRHTDRLWRSTSIQDFILRKFADQGIELWDFAAQHDYRSAHGRFTTFVLGAAAQLEKELTAERTREMKRGKALAGKPGGGPPPYGFTSQARLRHELIGKGLSPEAAAEEACRRLPAPGRFYLDEAEAAVVRLIFDLYTKEQLGCRRITDILNERGYRRRSGLIWVTQKVTRILTDPVVAGFVTYDEEAYRERRSKKEPKARQTLFQGEHEPIIEKEQWAEAGRLRERNRKLLRTKKSAARLYCLLGILRCGRCGQRMVGKASGPGKPAYYQCSARKYRGPRFGCQSPLVSARAVEEAVVREVEVLLSSPDLIHEFMARANEQLRAGRPDIKKEVERLAEQLRHLERAAEKFTRRYEEAADPESEEIAWSKLRETMVRKKALESELGERRRLLDESCLTSVSLEDTRRYLSLLKDQLGERPERWRAVLGLLEARHNLRVKLLDQERLLLTIRLEAQAFASGKDRRLLVVPGGDDPGSPTHVLTRELRLPEPDSAARWATKINGERNHLCACGCGEPVIVRPFHRWKGSIPRYRHGHHTMSMEKEVAGLNSRGLLTISQAAARLGVSEKVLRRRDQQLGLVPEWLTLGKRAPMRAYALPAVEALAAKLKGARS